MHLIFHVLPISSTVRITCAVYYAHSTRCELGTGPTKCIITSSRYSSLPISCAMNRRNHLPGTAWIGFLTKKGLSTPFVHPFPSCYGIVLSIANTWIFEPTLLPFVCTHKILRLFVLSTVNILAPEPTPSHTIHHAFSSSAIFCGLARE